jgi:heme oxygenase (biliverdin-producing, ferredoxin)
MTADVAEDTSSASVVTALYLRTKTLHIEAERTGIIRDLLRGEASRDGYVMLLRNLLPAYRELERGLERHRGSAILGALADYRLDRAPAIESDLAALCGPRWSQDVPLLDAGELYASRVSDAANGNGAKLIAHAYTRYLGDLSGGQILQRLMARSLQLRPAELSFYGFERFSDLNALKAEYRKALDQAGALAMDPQAVIEEGAIAFSLNIGLSCAVQEMVTSESAAVEQGIVTGG